ncbi:MAG: hypothetical protein J6J93_09225 [Muribaculaceae bacterium]|nr:hypothetical protein [Muribaculaceae bacterium]
MKKSLLTATLMAFAMCANAQTVVFEDDFEWLEPWSSQKPAGQTVEENNPDATAQQLGTNKVEDVSTYDALLAKGYEFPICCHTSKSPREAKAQVYLQRNYIKFGLTDYFSGITLPAMTEIADGAKTTIAFDWCSMRRGATAWDPTALVVIVKNGDTEEQFLVPTHEYTDGEEYAWLPVTVDLGTSVKTGSRITVRNIDSQWPSETAGEKCRWFIDNVKVTATTGTTAVDNIAVDAAAPAEYYNLQGVRIAEPENGMYIVRKGNRVSKVIK